jgi:hypothetical protein
VKAFLYVIGAFLPGIGWAPAGEPLSPSVTGALVIGAMVLAIFLLGSLWRLTHHDPCRDPPAHRPDRLV